MTKSEIISSVAQKASLAKTDAQAAIEALLETIEEALMQDKSINFTGFGGFSSGIRPARSVRNPRTGEPIELDETKVVKFKVGKNLKEKVANSK